MYSNSKMVFIARVIFLALAVAMCSGFTRSEQEFSKVYRRLDINDLGNGAQGKVFRVVKADDDLNQTVFAAKTYFQDLNFPEAVIKKYKINMEKYNGYFQEGNELYRELAAYERLPKTDHIGQLLEYYVEGDQRYMILKLIEGQSFDKIIWSSNGTKDEDGIEVRTRNHFERSQVLKWSMQLVDIIETLNEAGIVYGDFHFGNIMLRNDGQLVLTDFGWSFTLNYTGLPVNPADKCAKAVPKHHLRNKTLPLLDSNTISLAYALRELYNSSKSKGEEMADYKVIWEQIIDQHEDKESVARPPSLKFIKESLQNIIKKNEIQLEDSLEVKDMMNRLKDQAAQKEMQANIEAAKKAQQINLMRTALIQQVEGQKQCILQS